MTDYQMKCFDLIDAQQAKTTEGSTQWCVGEQLKEIAEREPEAAVILAEDLQSMTIMDAERQIKAFADKNHGKSNCFGVSPKQADKILREFSAFLLQQNRPLRKLHRQHRQMIST